MNREARKAALAAMLAVWHDRVAGGVQSSPQAHCEALLDAAMTGLHADTGEGEKGWTPWPDLHVRASRRDDGQFGLEAWRRDRTDHDRWDYTVLLPREVVDKQLATIRAAAGLDCDVC